MQPGKSLWKTSSIEPGKRADLVVLSENPLTAEDLRGIKVDRTVIDGATVFARL